MYNLTNYVNPQNNSNFFQGGVLHVERGKGITYAEFTGNKNNTPIAGRNMFYNPHERAWMRELKFNLSK